MSGGYGPFEAYVASGDTYPVRNQLKRLGFKWFGRDKVWYLSEPKWSESIARQLREMGASFSGSPASSTPGEAAPRPEPTRRIDPLEDTEDVEQTKWHKFPIKSSIRKFEIPLDYKGEHLDILVEVDRWYYESGDKYNRKKSAKKRGIPRYRVRIGEFGNVFYGSPGKWGTFDENVKLDEIEAKTKEDFEVEPPSKTKRAIQYKINVSKREPGLLEMLDRMSEEPEYRSIEITEAEPEYAGRHPVKIECYKSSDVLYIHSDIDSPHVPQQAVLGKIQIGGTRTAQELEQIITNFLQSGEMKNKYLEFLHSFPFLPEETEEEEEKWREVLECIKNPQTNADFVLGKLVDLGFVRPHRRQRQSEGLSSGEEIKWIMDHRAVVRGPSPSIPAGFYTLVAYLLHRQIKGIESWSEMGLTMDTAILLRKLKKLGEETSIGELEKVLEFYAAAARERWGFKDARHGFRDFYDFYSGGSGGSRGERAPQLPNKSEDQLLGELSDMARRWNVDPTGIAENPKRVYRELAVKTHPDKFAGDPAKQEEMKAVFQQLGNLWDEIKRTYKNSHSWYAAALKYG